MSYACEILLLFEEFKFKPFGVIFNFPKLKIKKWGPFSLGDASSLLIKVLTFSNEYLDLPNNNESLLGDLETNLFLKNSFCPYCVLKSC